MTLTDPPPPPLLWNFFIFFNTSLIQRNFCQALCPFCVHVSVCLKVQNWTQTDTKVTFHPPPPPATQHPPENFFWSQMKGMTKIRLLYSSAMALILRQLKDITHFQMQQHLQIHSGYKEPSINGFSVPISGFETYLQFDSHFHFWMQ